MQYLILYIQTDHSSKRTTQTSYVQIHDLSACPGLHSKSSDEISLLCAIRPDR